jgi:hypothetical protein
MHQFSSNKQLSTPNTVNAARDCLDAYLMCIKTAPTSAVFGHLALDREQACA